jgi:hypothetical protein
MSIKQTQIGTIRSLENFMQNFLLGTETVIVAHPVFMINSNLFLILAQTYVKLLDNDVIAKG